LLAHAPEFHELAASAFMDGAASLALALPRPSSEINPDALAQISFGFEAGVLLFYERRGYDTQNTAQLTPPAESSQKNSSAHPQTYQCRKR
jgi:hypothetical protein